MLYLSVFFLCLLVPIYMMVKPMSVVLVTKQLSPNTVTLWFKFVVKMFFFLIRLKPTTYKWTLGRRHFRLLLLTAVPKSPVFPNHSFHSHLPFLIILCSLISTVQRWLLLLVYFLVEDKKEGERFWLCLVTSLAFSGSQVTALTPVQFLVSWATTQCCKWYNRSSGSCSKMPPLIELGMPFYNLQSL